MRPARAAQRSHGGLLRLLALLVAFTLSLVVVVPRGSYGILPVAAVVAAYQTSTTAPSRLALPPSTQVSPANHTSVASTDAAPVVAADHFASPAPASSLSPPTNSTAFSWAGEAITQRGACAPTELPHTTDRLYLHICVLRN